MVCRKLPHTREMLRGSARVELAPELARQPHEPLIEKPRASAFFGANLLSMLIDLRVDTVIVTGCSPSGCIRGTCESAHDYNFHVIVPSEAVGDRSASAHQANLFDIDARYADVVTLQDVQSHILSLASRGSARRLAFVRREPRRAERRAADAFGRCPVRVADGR